jgi:hypothetical protein
VLRDVRRDRSLPHVPGGGRRRRFEVFCPNAGFIRALKHGRYGA